MDNFSKCKNIVSSEDYIEFIIEYSGDTSMLERDYNIQCYTIIDNQYIIIYVNADILKNVSLGSFDYSIVPKCYGLLDTSSLEKSNILRFHNSSNFTLRGEGIIIGIIDTGIDYMNNCFKYADNTSKILSIWDQTINSEVSPPEPFLYGTEYTKEQIDEALNSDNPRDIVPTVDDVGHGTFLASISAGVEIDDKDFVGVAPDSMLAVVKLRPAKKYIRDYYIIRDGAIAYQENNIIEAIKYLTMVSSKYRMPIVILLGIGTNQGSHAGRSALDLYFQSISDYRGVAGVCAGGNEGNLGHHFYGEMDNNLNFMEVELKVADNEKGFFLEFWGEAPSIYSIGFMSPTGEYVDRIQATLSETRTIRFLLDRTVINVDYKIAEGETGEQLITMRFENPTQGIWKIMVYVKTLGLKSRFNMWLPMEKFISNDTFFLRYDPDITLTSPANAVIPISVAGYNHYNNSIFINSSRGYTRIGVIKPEIVAPAVNVYGVVQNNNYITMSGTSIAAAHIAGVSALMLEWGIIKGNQVLMDTLIIKNFIIRGARRNENISYPNRVWGYGILDFYNIFLSLI